MSRQRVGSTTDAMKFPRYEKLRIHHHRLPTGIYVPPEGFPVGITRHVHLGPVAVLPRVGHGQQVLPVVLGLQAGGLILEFTAVDALAAGAVPPLEVTSLAHEPCTETKKKKEEGGKSYYCASTPKFLDAGQPVREEE